MKKSHGHLVLSAKVCDEKSCGRQLKMRLVMSKLPHNITKCYKHYKIGRLEHTKIKEVK